MTILEYAVTNSISVTTALRRFMRKELPADVGTVDPTDATRADWCRRNGFGLGRATKYAFFFTSSWPHAIPPPPEQGMNGSKPAMWWDDPAAIQRIEARRDTLLICSRELYNQFMHMRLALRQAGIKYKKDVEKIRKRQRYVEHMLRHIWVQMGAIKEMRKDLEELKAMNHTVISARSVDDIKARLFPTVEREH